MPDSVRCAADSSNAFTCAVEIDAEPEHLTCEAPEPVVPPLSSADPAVSRLVSRFPSKNIPVPPAPLITGASLLKCAPSEISIALAVASASKNPIVAALSMLKAGLETGACLAREHNEATQRNAVEYCHSLGGTVIGVEGDKTICAVEEPPK